MKYAEFNAGGELVARYDDTVNLIIPPAAVPIEDALFLQSVNEMDGRWMLLDGVISKHPFPAPILQNVADAAIAAIDAEAGAARTRYITVAPGQEATYMLKEAHARAYKAANYPAAAVADYPMVEAEAKAMSGDAPSAEQIQAAADGIVAQADAWIVKAAQIERARIAGKRAVGAAVDVAGVEAARAAAVAEMDAL